jgi:hypothetical protein
LSRLRPVPPQLQRFTEVYAQLEDPSGYLWDFAVDANGLVTVELAGCGDGSYYDDGSTYGDGELYSSTDNIKKTYQIDYDALVHFFSFRIAGSGHIKLDAIRLQVNAHKTQPFYYDVFVDKGDIKRMSFRITGSGCIEITGIRPIANIVRL